MKRARLLSFFLGTLLLLVGTVVAVKVWPKEESHRGYDSESKSADFWFSSIGTQTKTVRVELVLKPEETEQAKQVLSAVYYEIEQIRRFPGTASGYVRCLIEIQVNGELWIRDNHETPVASSPDSDWTPESRNETANVSSRIAIPDPDTADITGKLRHSAENRLVAQASCTVNVHSTGPTLVRITLGPLFALVDE